MAEPVPKQRLDKWLWHARFFKTRTLAAAQVRGGHVRVNTDRAGKPALAVSVGDVLTFSQARTVRVVRIEALADRRGPASEARDLYTDLAPAEEKPARNPGFEGKGRPTKRNRRALDLSRRQTLD